MSRVSERAYEEMLELAVAALHERHHDRLLPLLTGHLLRSLGAGHAIRKAEEWNDGSPGLDVWTPGGMSDRTVDEDAQACIRTGSPFTDFYRATGELVPVTARSITGGRVWRNSEAAAVARETFGASSVLALPLAGRFEPIHGYLVYRQESEFTAEHLAYARRVQPLLAGVEKQCRYLRRWEEALPVADRVGAHETAGNVRLTARETTVLLLLGESLTAASIGRRLGMSVSTVHKHMGSIYRKLGTSDRLSAVLRAQRYGLLPSSAAADSGHAASGTNCRCAPADQDLR